MIARMERSDRKGRREKKRPRVPIKTYRWEDIRRSRKRGGYPWTHLYKPPFNEDLDPEPYTMEGMRKAKSSSTMAKSDIDISEVSDFSSVASGEIIERMQIVTEPPEDHSKPETSSSVIIEECEDKPLEDTLEPAESWDNISQYLDKEERDASMEKKATPGPVQEPEPEPEPEPKVDQLSPRKRKLSAESSQSKLSQTKTVILNKITNAKNKIKVPKLTFPISKFKVKKPATKKKSSPPEIKKESKSSSSSPTKKKEVKPVYIHIPLKPPKGQTDEFSYLELESMTDKNEKPRKPGTFRDLVKQIKQAEQLKRAQEPIEEEKNEENKENLKPAVTEETDKEPKDLVFKTKLKRIGKINLTSTESKDEPIQKLEVTTESEAKSTEEMEVTPSKKESAEPKENLENIFSKCEKYTKPAIPTEEEPTIPEEKSILPDEEDKATTTEGEEEYKGEDIFEHLFKASSSKQVQPSFSQETNERIRSKSAEPEGTRRKLSMESSYSRKSLSKLNFLKKIKDASNKIRNTLSRSNSKKKKPPNLPQKEEVKKEKKSKELKPQKQIEPVYIHIPLKPPEGQTDEFSYLAKEEKPAPPVQPAEPTEQSTASTPDTPERKEGVQFIILTAPSDDEILDNSSDAPETPSSEGKPFFVTKISELKQIAKEAVDNVEGKKLAAVEEESTSDKEGNGEKKEEIEKIDKINEKDTEKLKGSDLVKTEAERKSDVENDEQGKKDAKNDEKHTDQIETVAENVAETNKSSTKEEKSTNNMVVDEEDGLNETVKEEKDKSEDKKEKENQIAPVKSSLKGGGGSPVVIKKKVSFKRRSRSSKDDSYEDIQAPDLELNTKKVGKEDVEPITGKVEDVAASVIDRVMKERMIEDDKWSKMSDHEYEPVNPPPDYIEPSSNLPPTVYIVDTDYDSSILPIGTISFENNTTTTTSVTPSETRAKENPAVKTDTPVTSSSSKKTASSDSSEKPKESPSKFQLVLKQKTDNFKNKLHSIKRPHITLPERPKFNKPDFKKFKINKPNIHLPKIPDTAKINLPHFSLHSGKRSLSQQRQLSTESQDGDSKKPIFDFSTYPRRIKDKFKSKRAQESNFATVPRTKKNEPKQEASSRWSGSESIRIPLHSEDSMDLDEKLPPGNSDLNVQDDNYLNNDNPAQFKYDEHVAMNEENLSPGSYDENTVGNEDNPSHVRYDEDIDIDDDYDRENNELNQERDFMNRWNQGRFNEDFNEEYLQNLKNSKYKVTDLDSPEENSNFGYDYQAKDSDRDRDRYSSGSSFGHRRGVIEEINSDEFFWRPKGISQDDINVSMNISSEIREAFRTPANTLAQIEKIQDHNFDIGGSHQSLPEAGKKKSIKKPKRKKTPHASQEKLQRPEESADEDLELSPPSRPKRRSKRKKKDKNSEQIIPYRETISVDIDIIPTDERLAEHRESLGMLGDDEQDEDIVMYTDEKGKEHAKIASSDAYNFQFADDDDEEGLEKPAAPPRKQKSLKSLNTSENDSILGESGLVRDVLEPDIEAIRAESKVIIPIQTDVPPPRPSRTRSRTSSQSRGTSQVDEESIHEDINRFDYEQEGNVPCVEEPCIQDIRDYMGYAIVDKTKVREPPLPPPRIPSRQKRSHKEDKGRFNTVSRAGGDDVPVRPLRNYSTLGQAKKTSNTYENKENIDITQIDITQYVEIDEEPIKDLQSGEVIQKMKDRPLPAPPRPPRKSRPFKDITSKENIMQEVNDELEKARLEEIEASTQTEPLPDDFVCEELVQEPSDKILIPSGSAEAKPSDTVTIERILITPTHYTHQETVTHGSLLVEPLNGAQLLPNSELSKERIIPVTCESDDETSSIPEEFTKLADPMKKSIERKRISTPTETEVLKAHRLQVTDLDVEKLTVNQLLANKIIVSEIDSGNIQTNEISSRSGSLIVGEINMPPDMINKIIETIKSTQSEADGGGQKKNFD